MSFLFGPTPLERKIETATSDLLIDSDWGLNTEVWELIRRSDDGYATLSPHLIVHLFDWYADGGVKWSKVVKK
jgi:hypothetical protein